jgi:hypothetical protein
MFRYAEKLGWQPEETSSLAEREDAKGETLALVFTSLGPYSCLQSSLWPDIILPRRSPFDTPPTLPPSASRPHGIHRHTLSTPVFVLLDTSL